MNEVTRLTPAREAIAFTAMDFERMLRVGAFTDMRAELVSGAIEKMMPSLPGHGERNLTIGAKLIAAFAGQPVRIGTDMAVRIDEATIRAPDIVVADAAIALDRVPDAAQILLVVEVADTTLGRDLGIKLVDYARSGIAHYWVVDAGARVVRVMSQPTAVGYVAEAAIRFGEQIAVPGTDCTITID